MKVFEGKHVIVLERDGWEFVERKRAREAVAVIAIVGDQIILTEQFRRPVAARVIDLPAGLIEEFAGEETAKRELLEETGYRCDRIELLAAAATSPGITSEVVSFYRAIGARREGEGGGIEGEEITVHSVPLQQITDWLQRKAKEGILIDLKIWAALYFVLQST